MRQSSYGLLFLWIVGTLHAQLNSPVLQPKNSPWEYQGCYYNNATDSILWNYMDIKDNVDYGNFSNCAQWAINSGFNVMGLEGVKCGGCYNCNDFKRYGEVKLQRCPDYGRTNYVQLFTRSSLNKIVLEDELPTFYDRLNSVLYEQGFNVEYTGQIYLQYTNLINKGLNCPRLMESLLNSEHIWPPPKLSEIPDELLAQFTSNFLIPYAEYYFNDEQMNGNGEVIRWTEELLRSSIRMNYCFPTTGFSTCNHMIQHHGHRFAGKRGAVIGSMRPWLEASLLYETNMSHVITIEYAPIHSDIAQLTTLTPKQAANRYLADDWREVDFIFSFSSIEHSGLGRYGDPLDPHGDILAINQIFCFLKPGGLLYLTIPTGTDAFLFNAHRIYGKYRLLALFAGWKLIDVIGDADIDSFPKSMGTEPIYVLQKPLE